MNPYYQDDLVTIYHGDCLEIDAWLEADVLITDPPYSLTASGGGIGAKRAYLKGITKANLESGFDISVLEKFSRWVVFCAKDQLIELLSLANEQGRWMLVTWNKPNPTPLVNANYLPDTEYIIHKFDTANHLYGGYETRSRFIVHPVKQTKIDHPTVKPLAVMSRMVRIASDVGETIADPFMGSGSTLVAAKSLGRKAIGVEIEEKYCEIAAKRCGQDYLFSEVAE